MPNYWIFGPNQSINSYFAVMSCYQGRSQYPSASPVGRQARQKTVQRKSLNSNCALTFLLKRHKVNFMGDKYFYKREKVANLLFDLVKYLLTALGATVLFTDKIISTGMIVIAAFMAVLVFVLGIFITPKKED